MKDSAVPSRNVLCSRSRPPLVPNQGLDGVLVLSAGRESKSSLQLQFIGSAKHRMDRIHPGNPDDTAPMNPHKPFGIEPTLQLGEGFP